MSVQSHNFYLNAYVGFVRWLAIRLEFIGACIVFAAVLLAVISRNMDSETITAGAAGLSITYALSVSLSLQSYYNQGLIHYSLLGLLAVYVNYFPYGEFGIIELCHDLIYYVHLVQQF